MRLLACIVSCRHTMVLVIVVSEAKKVFLLEAPGKTPAGSHRAQSILSFCVFRTSRIEPLAVCPHPVCYGHRSWVMEG